MPLTRLLAATDGSEHGDHAVDYARALAASLGAELQVVGVETDGLPVAASTRSAVRRAATADSMVWARGVPGVEIVRRAEAWQADLLLLGRRSRTPAAPLQLGPTSDTVIRRRHRATLLLPWSVSRIQRVLIALDGTRRGLGVLTTAAEFVAATGAEPTALFVLPEDPTGHDVDGPWSNPLVGRVTDGLSRFRILQRAGVLKVRRGSAVREVLACVEETGADALVLGVRRGGPAGELGSGHVGRDLLQSAPRAILTVPI
jgi:nucleotide-binding universal stress UspA family protein